MTSQEVTAVAAVTSFASGTLPAMLATLGPATDDSAPASPRGSENPAAKIRLL